ncbi:MAG TPA: NAD(P)-binding oxidoreductase, partial [Cellulomonas sp.]|nr:NAD(P)-binding oxidoreductase [Cellulomonas sp.]
MKLTIVAASGGIGRAVLEQAVAAGHDVTAVVRDPARLPATTARVVALDLAAADTGALVGAVAGADAVLSGLGARTKADTGIAARGTTTIVDAMRTAGTRRLVVVSAAPIGTVASAGRPQPPRHDPGDGFFMRHMFSHLAKAMFREHYVDLAEMEDVVRASGLDWTVVRPPKLTDKALTGEYRTAVDENVRGGWSVPRADVAHLMLALASDDASV